MATDEKIKDEKLQCNINIEAGKISSLLSGKIDKYEYLAGKEILPSDQSRMIEQANFTYSPLWKALEKQTKTIKDQGEKQVKAIKNRIKRQILDTEQKPITDLFSKGLLSEEVICELNKTKETEQKIDRDDLIYKTGYKKKREKPETPDRKENKEQPFKNAIRLLWGRQKFLMVLKAKYFH